MWLCKGPAGLMKIFKNEHGTYSLQIGDEVCGFYQSPVAAADNVFTFTTGCGDWDDLDGSIDPPTDIFQWKRL